MHRKSDERIDWNVYNSPEPFNINALGPKAHKVKEKIDGYVPSASEKIFKSRLEKENGFHERRTAQSNGRGRRDIQWMEKSCGSCG